MNKINFFALLFLAASIIGSVADGTGSIATTRLSANVTDAVAIIPVDSTTGFLTADYAVIGNEWFYHTGKTANTFTGCTRGYNSTTASAHLNDAYVYCPETNVWNSALGFNITETGTTGGLIGLATVPLNFFRVTMPRLVMWDFNFLKTGNMQYVRLVLQIISIGFVITIVLQILSALGATLPW